MAFPEEIKLFVGDLPFALIWMKQMLIWFNLQRDGNELSNIKGTFAQSL